MKDIIIVCAGCVGLEVYFEILSLNKLAREKNREEPYRIIGFLSDVPDVLNGKNINAEIIGDVQNWIPKGDEVYALGLRMPDQKERIATLLKGRGANFESIISIDAKVPDDLIVGEGCFVTSSTIGCGVTLGNFVSVQSSLIMGGSNIGDYSSTTGFTVVEHANVGKSVYIGSEAVITEGCDVGDGAKVCAGCVVMESIEPGITVFGVPARRMR